MSLLFNLKIQRIPGTLRYKYEEIYLGYLTNRIIEKLTLIYIFENGSIQITGNNIYFTSFIK